jgi:hypothetical protein
MPSLPEEKESHRRHRQAIALSRFSLHTMLETRDTNFWRSTTVATTLHSPQEALGATPVQSPTLICNAEPPGMPGKRTG